jgi:hypothetical protein
MCNVIKNGNEGQSPRGISGGQNDAGTGSSRGTTISAVSIIMPMLRTHTPSTTDEI